ncbi:hypothetical protein FE810_10975 [Thalassotalea litorea]|uniref:Cytochrome c domain-containing protein n=1 Tax=Thalassotalea litorea TaxID=2020715 RepID=A0A5R9IRS5_9GAMM|nr:c-type cytochrome [Thalassotalea litorea]TLU64608.1 hypothetical protein FE810_10975 [Thalassotalea litorea]
MTAPDIGMNQRTLVFVAVMLLFFTTVKLANARDSGAQVNTNAAINASAAINVSADINTHIAAELDSISLQPEPVDTNAMDDGKNKAEAIESVALSPAQRLRKQRRLDAQVQFCSPCHGINGVARQSLYPDLAGKSQEYLLNTLLRYKQTKAPDAIMPGMVAPLSEEDLQALASYYAQQSLPHNTMLAVEKEVHTEAISDQTIPGDTANIESNTQPFDVGTQSRLDAEEINPK